MLSSLSGTLLWGRDGAIRTSHAPPAYLHQLMGREGERGGIYIHSSHWSLTRGEGVTWVTLHPFPLPPPPHAYKLGPVGHLCCCLNRMHSEIGACNVDAPLIDIWDAWGYCACHITTTEKVLYLKNRIYIYCSTFVESIYRRHSWKIVWED